MLKPTVELHKINGLILAEFWDCLRLDPGVVQTLRTLYEDHVRSGGRPVLLVDLLGVGFAGSAALGHFVALHRVARSKGGRLIFCNVDPNVFEVFRVSKLDPLFTFVADRDAALAEAERAEGGDREAATPHAPGADVTPHAPRTAGPVRKSTGDGLLRSSRRRKLG